MFVTGVDDIMAGSFPEDIVENAKKMNKAQVLKMTKDHNTFSKILRRSKRNILSCVGKKSSRSKRKSCECLDFFNELLNVVINIWYSILNNFQIVIYNYFVWIICFMVQYVGFYYNLSQREAKEEHLVTLDALLNPSNKGV